ncbi:MAG: sigma-70 family RNA polymerase sigma factor [Actinomycetota bacterium]|nr:sigma-70 family RNA polymerase sigma factor [Actinomycetota bacterium]
MRGVSAIDPRTDSELLAATTVEPEAFGAFYRRHVHAVLSYLVARTGRPEIAADLCAETFASALEQVERYDPARGPARAWLLTMARSRMLDSFRSGQVEDRARRRLGMPPRSLTDHDIERIEELVDVSRRFDAEALVAELPDDQREAVLARVVEERDYGEIAAELKVSQSVVRQRVSRGLASLRARLQEGPR